MLPKESANLLAVHSVLFVKSFHWKRLTLPDNFLICETKQKNPKSNMELFYHSKKINNIIINEWWVFEDIKDGAH